VRSTRQYDVGAGHHLVTGPNVTLRGASLNRERQSSARIAALDGQTRPTARRPFYALADDGVR